MTIQGQDLPFLESPSSLLAFVLKNKSNHKSLMKNTEYLGFIVFVCDSVFSKCFCFVLMIMIFVILFLITRSVQHVPVTFLSVCNRE